MGWGRNLFLGIIYSQGVWLHASTRHLPKSVKFHFAGFQEKEQEDFHFFRIFGQSFESLKQPGFGNMRRKSGKRLLIRGDTNPGGVLLSFQFFDLHKFLLGRDKAKRFSGSAIIFVDHFWPWCKSPTTMRVFHKKAPATIRCRGFFMLFTGMTYSNITLVLNITVPFSGFCT